VELLFQELDPHKDLPLGLEMMFFTSILKGEFSLALDQQSKEKKQKLVIQSLSHHQDKGQLLESIQ